MEKSLDLSYSWLNKLYNTLEEDFSTDRALDILFEETDEAFLAGNFEYVDNMFDKVDLTKLNSALVVGILCSSNLARDKLKNWNTMVSRARKELESRPDCKNKIEDLMRGFDEK